MTFARYIQPVNPRSVVFHMGGIAWLVGLTLAVPTLAAVIATEWSQSVWFGGTSFLFGVSGWLLRRGPERDLEMNEALVVTALAYLVFAIAGAIPFLPHVPAIDALFESMSGFTTTGLTVVPLAALPSSLLFFRAFSQWIGGAGIIILSVVILTGSGLSSKRLYGLEFGEDKLAGNVRATARLVFRVYAVLTAAGILALALSGASYFEALLLAPAALSTGGFSPYPDSVGRFADGAVPWVLTGLMLLGATSLPLYHLARRQGPAVVWRDPQTRALMLTLLASTLLLWFSANFDLGRLFPSVFQAASSITTTGFGLSREAEWSDSTKVLTLLLMSIGGSTGSTAGGIKLLRIIMTLAVIRWFVVRLLLPREAHVPLRVGAATVEREDLDYVFAFVAGYVLVLLLSGLALTLAGYPGIDALYESASAIGTVGLSTGIASAEAPGWVKILLSMEMWIGRVELMPVLVLLYWRTWFAEKGGS